MLDINTLVIAAICLVIGAIIGAVVRTAIAPGEKQQRALAEKLQAREDELKLYQQDVTEHFIKSSELLGEMQRQQQQATEQLLASASRLATPDTNRRIQDNMLPAADSGRHLNILSLTPQEPPKDYAPGRGNVLSENYGLADSGDATALRGTPAGHNAASEDGDSDDDPTYKIS